MALISPEFVWEIAKTTRISSEDYSEKDWGLEKGRRGGRSVEAVWHGDWWKRSVSKNLNTEWVTKLVYYLSSLIIWLLSLLYPVPLKPQIILQTVNPLTGDCVGDWYLVFLGKCLFPVL